MKRPTITLQGLVLAVAALSAALAIFLAVYLPHREGRREDEIQRNEGEAVATLVEIVNLQSWIQARQVKTYAGLASLQALYPDAPYVSTVSAGVRSGYSFVVATDADRAFTCHSFPTAPGRTGRRRFFVDPTGLIRQSERGMATSGSPPAD